MLFEIIVLSRNSGLFNILHKLGPSWGYFESTITSAWVNWSQDHRPFSRMYDHGNEALSLSD